MTQRLTFLITAGPTQESFDPVRYFTNHSSGKMGYALATTAKKMGHNVILISGPTALAKPQGVQFIPVITAKEMYTAVMKNFGKADVILKVAAVADYRPIHVAKQKIKKFGKFLTIHLILNPDILKELGKKKRANQILVGFAAETRNGLHYAQKKLKEKNCDWIVLNNVSKKGIGFGAEENEVTLLSRSGNKFSLNRASKKAIAQQILQNIIE
jgi:phosphopantothenoylcysteine decarboxylase/phosphopantothenate--cysteine ligase